MQGPLAGNRVSIDWTLSNESGTFLMDDHLRWHLAVRSTELMDFKVIDQNGWDKYPISQPKTPPNRWEEVLLALEGGDIVELAVPEEKLRGTRIGLARSASTRGFKVEYRYNNGRLAVRKGDTPLPPKEPKARKLRAKKTEGEAEA